MPSHMPVMSALPESFEADLHSDAFYQNPYPVYARIRASSTVYWSSSWQSWLITRFSDCDAVLRDASRFSNADRFSQILASVPELERCGRGMLEEHVRLGVANADRPEHTRLRSLMQQGFHPRDIAPMGEYVASVVEQLVAAVDASAFDLVDTIARPLSAIVICDVFGIAREERHHFKALVDATAFHGSGSDLATRAVKAVSALEALDAWLKPLIADRRVKPQDDMLGRLVAATDRGDIMSDDELVTTCIVIVRAGQVTTEGLVGNGLAALLANRDQWGLIVNDRELIPQAVEEMLRFDTSFLRTLRRAVVDVDLDGRSVKAGDLVSVMLGAANRDPARWDCPDLFDLTRSGKRHLGFGVGSHFCLGAPLARLEAATALEAIVERWPGLSLAGAIEWQRDNVMRAPVNLPVMV
jgi:cytochrome P450